MAEYDSPFDTLATLAEVGSPGFSRRDGVLSFLGVGVPWFSSRGVPGFSVELGVLGLLGIGVLGFPGGAFLGFP